MNHFGVLRLQTPYLWPPRKRQKTIILREDSCKNFDLLAQLRDLMLPVEMHAGHSNHRHEVHLRIRLT